MRTSRIGYTLAVVSSLCVWMSFTASVARAGSTPPAARYGNEPDITSFSGRAIGAQVKVAVPVSTRIYADTGDLAPAGGNISASLASIADAVFTSGPVSCNSTGGGSAATSSSVMANLSAYAGTAAALTCSSIRTDTQASCSGGALGSSTISGLVFAGVSVTVTGAANQTVSIPGVATLVINEQVQAAGSIEVHGLHVTLVSGDELTICSSHSDIAGCVTPTRSATWGEVKLLYR